MKTTSTAVTRVPQSGGISAPLRRLASRRAAGAFALGLALAGSLHSASAATFSYTGGATAAAPVSGSFSGTGFGTDVTTSTAADTLSFAGTTYTATDDLTQQILVNKLSFTNTGAVILAATTGANNSISLGGTTPTVTVGTGNVVSNLDLALTVSTGFIIGSGGMTENGVISGAGTLTKTNSGILTLSGANTYAGNTTLTSGKILATNSTALGTGTITTGNSTNTGNLQLSGGISLVNAITEGGRGNSSLSIESVSGSNALSGNINYAGGGQTYSIASDAGSTLTLSGTQNLSQTASATRTLQLFGAGDGIISGQVTQAGPFAGFLTFSSTGTWTLANSTNNYTGGTTVNSGTLALAAAAADGMGTLTVNAGGTTTVTANNALGGGNVILAGGTLANGNILGTNATNMQTSKTLSLTTGKASTLDFGAVQAGAVFTFTGFDGANTGTLSILNYLGTPNIGLGVDQLIIGGTPLTAVQLGQISFMTGGQMFGATQLASGEVVEYAPVAAPEPSQYAAFAIGLLGLGALALKASKRTLSA